MDGPMKDNVVLEPDVEAALDAMLAEMRQLNAKIAEDQRRSARLKAETRVITEEAHRLAERTQATLDRIEAVMARW